MIRQLKPEHPTYKKIVKLMNYADELGIHISFTSYSTKVSDIDFPDQEFDLDDLEQNMIMKHAASISEFPYSLEFKLTYEREEEE